MTVMGFSLLLPQQQQQEHLSVLVQIYVFSPILPPPPNPTFSVPQHTVPPLPLTLAVLPAPPPIGESVRGVVVQQVFVVAVVAVVAAEVVVLVR